MLLVSKEYLLLMPVLSGIYLWCYCYIGLEFLIQTSKSLKFSSWHPGKNNKNKNVFSGRAANWAGKRCLYWSFFLSPKLCCDLRWGFPLFYFERTIKSKSWGKTGTRVSWMWSLSLQQILSPFAIHLVCLFPPISSYTVL